MSNNLKRARDDSGSNTEAPAKKAKSTVEATASTTTATTTSLSHTTAEHRDKLKTISSKKDTKGWKRGVEVSVKLLETSLNVYRTLVFPSNMKLVDVSTAIQTAFGWKGDKEHKFVMDQSDVAGYEAGPAKRGAARWNEKTLQLSMLLPEDNSYTGPLMKYYYGTDPQWVLSVTVNLIREQSTRVEIARIARCIGGSGGAPTESDKDLRDFEKKQPKRAGFDSSGVDKVNAKLSKGRNIPVLVPSSTSSRQVNNIVLGCLSNPQWWGLDFDDLSI